MEREERDRLSLEGARVLSGLAVNLGPYVARCGALLPSSFSRREGGRPVESYHKERGVFCSVGVHVERDTLCSGATSWAAIVLGESGRWLSYERVWGWQTYPRSFSCFSSTLRAMEASTVLGDFAQPHLDEEMGELRRFFLGSSLPELDRRRAVRLVEGAWSGLVKIHDAREELAVLEVQREERETGVLQLSRMPLFPGDPTPRRPSLRGL